MILIIIVFIKRTYTITISMSYQSIPKRIRVVNDVKINIQLFKNIALRRRIIVNGIFLLPCFIEGALGSYLSALFIKAFSPHVTIGKILNDFSLPRSVCIADFFGSY